MSGSDLLDEVRRWLRFAHEDLRAAEALLTAAGSRPRHACWLAQQAAEKAIKAALAHEQKPFPFRHDLDALRNLLPDGWTVKVQCPDLAELTEWAVEARYPGGLARGDRRRSSARRRTRPGGVAVRRPGHERARRTGGLAMIPSDTVILDAKTGGMSSPTT